MLIYSNRRLECLLYEGCCAGVGMRLGDAPGGAGTALWGSHPRLLQRFAGRWVVGRALKLPPSLGCCQPAW